MNRSLPLIVSVATFLLLSGILSGCGWLSSSLRPVKLERARHENAAAGSYVPQPIPRGPEANTDSNYVMSVAHPFYTRFWLDPFRSSSEARAPWAADAVGVLGREIFGLASGWRGAMADIRAQTPPLIEKGCTYPVIRWMYALHLEKEKKASEALRVMTDLERDVATNAAWPSPLHALVAAGALRLSSNETHEAALIDALYTTLTDGSFRTNETRVAWKFCAFCGMDKNPRFLSKLLETDNPRLDPWFALMMQGHFAYDKAWEARGPGYADTVNDDGWTGFRDAMKEAYDALTRAWKLHPEIPDAAGFLIDCVRGDREASRLWFDRAVAAQMDYIPAYSSYRFTLTPRWCGSVPAMVAFAEECLNTRRYDTDVPLQYVSGLYDAAAEVKEEWQALFQKPGVYEACKLLFANGLSRSFDTNWVGKRYYHTGLAYTAYAVGDYDTAWQSSQHLRNPDGRIGYDKRIRPPPPFHDIAMTMISGLNGPNKNALREADRLARKGDAVQALAAFGALADSHTLSSDEMDAVAYWEIELGKRLACAKGEWFSLIKPHTTTFLDGPWISYYNSWRYSNLTWRTESNNGLLGSTIIMPRDIAYELTFAPSQDDPKSPCHFGFALDSKPGTSVEGPVLWLARDNGEWTAAWVRRFGPDCRTSRPLSGVQKLAPVTSSAIHLSVTSQGDKVTASINGEPVCDRLDFSDIFYDKLRSGRLPYLFGSHVVLTEWRMRHLANKEL